ncbi:MAG: xanthine dehydrogenase family protein molybdopterin-binding subunit, partial [Elusimicrobia bacterium]|nr:xanthine dehydrogenase family protein molybdopterin-binding subunit [Elusimicrobiota bacterium]
MRTIGKNIKRVDAFGKVTGQARYIDDIYFQGMLYVKILRSSVAHAKIVDIKTNKAEKVPGVRKVITGKNCKILVGGCIIDQPPMAVDKVRYIGEPVAAVVGINPDICEQARDLIEVKYKEIPSVFDSVEAAKKNAPLVHPALGKYKVLPGFSPKPGTNIYHHYKLRQGKTEEGFRKCDLIVEAEYTYPHISHCQLEPHGGIARWDSKGGVEIFSSTQAPFVVRDFISRAFNLPYSKVRSHMPEIGGGFG